MGDMTLHYEVIHPMKNILEHASILSLLSKINNLLKGTEYDTKPIKYYPSWIKLMTCPKIAHKHTQVYHVDPLVGVNLNIGNYDYKPSNSNYDFKLRIILEFNAM